MISVAICTRDRPERVVGAVQSVLANAGATFELLVIDQSSDDRTGEALRRCCRDPRVRYIRSDARGVACSRNQALLLARADVVAYTDDDCIVPPEWLACMERIFDRMSRVTLAFCNVVGAPHDRSAGFIPEYRRKGKMLVTTPFQWCAARGIGAGMAVRRRAALEMGGFDEMLGPGGPFQSAEDFDLALRLIALGHQIYVTDEVEVVHYGFRTWAEGKSLTSRDFFGTGAAYSKPFRSGRLRLAVVPLWELLRHAVWPPMFDVLCLRKPRGWKRITGFVAGMVRGLRTPLDSHTLRFVMPHHLASVASTRSSAWQAADPGARKAKHQG